MSILLLAKLTLLFAAALTAAMIVPFLTITLPPLRVLPASPGRAIAGPSVPRFLGGRVGPSN